MKITRILKFCATVGAMITKTSAIEIRNNNICGISRDFGSNFTGAIIQYQATIEVPPQNHARITRCHEGKRRAYDAYMPVKYSQDISWGKKFCTGQKNQKSVCYVLARREITSHRRLSLFPPGEWVGGIFMCPGSLEDDSRECNNKNAVPLWPLIAVNFTHYEEIVRNTQITRVPYLVSYNVEDRKANKLKTTTHIPDNWAEFIDVMEDYEGGKSDRTFNRMAWDVALSSIKIFLKTFHYATTFGSTQTFKDYGDGGSSRRFARELPYKVSFEEYPETFRTSPGDDYLLDMPEDDGFFKREVKNADAAGSRKPYVNSLPEFDMAPENYYRYLYSTSYDDYDYGMYNSVSENESDDEISIKRTTVPISLGWIVQLSVDLPLQAFTYILNNLYDANRLAKDEILGNPNFSHASSFYNPSVVLDNIHRRAVPRRSRRPKGDGHRPINS